MEVVLKQGTFVGSLNGKTYFGVRYDKDRVFALRRMLNARSYAVKEFDVSRYRHDVVESGIFLSFESLHKTRHRIFEGEWYVVNTDNEVYIMSENRIMQFSDLSPMGFDWDKHDIFPRKLDMNKYHHDDRYGKD